VQLSDSLSAHFKGVVTSFQFLGDHCAVEIKVDDSCVVHAKLSSRSQLLVGSQVSFNVNTESGIC
jgi:hypothetical protein